ncbi:hypothetical protein JCM5353_007639 [Sporobolomyces roseus]
MDPLDNHGLQDLAAHDNLRQMVYHEIALHRAAIEAGEAGNREHLLLVKDHGSRTFYHLFGKWMRINETNHLETYNERTGRVDEVIPRSAHQASIGHRMAAIYGFRNREDWRQRNGRSGRRI